MMRCIVLDDERIAREGLREYIGEFDFLQCVGDFADPLQAADMIKNKEIDLIFLDIEMPRIKGIQFAERFSNSSTMIVFTTAYAEYALKGYKVNAIDYLLKPIFFDDFKKAVLKAKSLFDLMYPDQEEQRFFFFREDGIDRRILLSDIVYVKSLQNYIQIHLNDDRTIIVHKTLKALQELVNSDEFIQIHRSYVVQRKYISAVDGSVAVVNNTTLPIARDRKQALAELIRNGR